MKFDPQVRKRYYLHRYNAGKRGVPFLITLEDWWHIWETSGKWEQRGRGRDEYCMSRFGDRGAYEIGNIRITTNTENYDESRTKRDYASSININKLRADPDFCVKQSTAARVTMSKLQSDPEFCAKRDSNIRKFNLDPASQAKRIVGIEKREQDQEYRAERRARLIAFNKQRGRRNKCT